MEVGALDVRRKPAPEGFYKGRVASVDFKDGKTRDGEDVVKAKIRITLLTDCPSSDESTIGKSVFDNIPWTEDMSWKIGVIYAAANDLAEDDEALEDMTPDKFKEGVQNKEMYFDVVHNWIDGDDDKPRRMVNIQNYKSIVATEQQ